MATKRYPGVYINETSNFPRTVAPVATAIPAFIGYTEKRVKNGIPLDIATPVKINSLLEYREIFGGAFSENLVVTLNGPDTDASKTIIQVAPASNLSPYNLYYNLELYFANGGGSCYIVSIGLYSESSIPVNPSTLIRASDLKTGIAAVEYIDEVTLLVVPEAIILNTSERKIIYDSLLLQCGNLRDRFSILDVFCDLNGTVKQDAANFRNQLGNNYLKYGAAYYPSLKTTLELSFENSGVEIIDSRSGETYAEGTTLNDVLHGVTIPGSANINQADKTLFYTILQEIRNKFEMVLYPSATMAAIYARVDRERGVWKSPANVSLNFVKEPIIGINNAQQEYLNVDSVTGKSINAIRKFPAKGTTVWGARTLAGNDNEWKYLSVSRFFLFVEESLKKSTEFVVFEPNDANTWLRVKSMIENFLIGLWKDGALNGSKPEQAFFVKVGLGETMTAKDILEGRLNIKIGMAVVKPAEFIILKFSHKTLKS